MTRARTNQQLNEFMSRCKLWLMLEVLELVTRKNILPNRVPEEGGQEICYLEVFKKECHDICLIWTNPAFNQAWEQRCGPLGATDTKQESEE